mmetsp:Transcript_29894/g.38547  ORF Transcript_29894/g.38547 Transcript_29894/m.38547 type:complete len:97 (-) Transcript_29894:1094-1384(-)
MKVMNINQSACQYIFKERYKQSGERMESFCLVNNKYYSNGQALIANINMLHLYPSHHDAIYRRISFAASRDISNDSTSQTRVLVRDEGNVPPVMHI